MRTCETGCRVRRLAAVVTIVLALYLTIGHTFHRPNMPGGGAMPHSVGICLVLFTLAAAVAISLPQRIGFRPHPRLAMPLIRRRVPLPLGEPRARASPIWLQRFLN